MSLLKIAREHKLARWLFILAIIVDLLGLAYMGYLAFWPMKSIVVHGDDKILNPDKQVRPGEVLVYQIDYCKYTDKQAAVTRSLKNEKTTAPYPLLAATNNVATGCRKATVRNLIIPDGVEPGFYTLELSVSYQLNPLRVATVRHRSERFEVLPKLPQPSSDTPVTAVAASDTSGGASVVSGARSVPVSPGAARTVATPVPQPTVTPAPTPAPEPGLLSRVVNAITKAIGL
jgi:hypothetical protein